MTRDSRPLRIRSVGVRAADRGPSVEVGGSSVRTTSNGRTAHTRVHSNGRYDTTTARPQFTRRTALRLIVLALAAGCGESKHKFESIDVSGADWGQDFHLRDPQGRARTLADFRGKAVLVFFGFTQCPDVCPTALARAAEVKRLLGDDAARLQVIFVTIDPERDPPSVLNDYTHAFDPSFLGLWGDASATQAAARDFKVYYRKVPTGASYTMDHSTISYAFDPSGQLRLAIQHSQSAASVAADLRALLHEVTT